MLTAGKYAKMGKEVMSLTKELLLLQIHAVVLNDFPRTNHVAAQQGESPGCEAERAIQFFFFVFSFCQCCPKLRFCVIPSNMNSEFR